MTYLVFSAKRLRRTGRTKINPLNEIRRVIRETTDANVKVGFVNLFRSKRRQLRKIKRFTMGMSPARFRDSIAIWQSEPRREGGVTFKITVPKKRK